MEGLCCLHFESDRAPTAFLTSEKCALSCSFKISPLTIFAPVSRLSGARVLAHPAVRDGQMFPGSPGPVFWLTRPSGTAGCPFPGSPEPVCRLTRLTRPLSRHQPSLSSGALDSFRTRRMPRKSYSHTISPACPLEVWTASARGTCHAAAHSHAISPACSLELWTDSEHGGCHAKPTLTPSAQPVICSSSLLSPAHPLDLCQGCPPPCTLAHHQPTQ